MVRLSSLKALLNCPSERSGGTLSLHLLCLVLLSVDWMTNCLLPHSCMIHEHMASHAVRISRENPSFMSVLRSSPGTRCDQTTRYDLPRIFLTSIALHRPWTAAADTVQHGCATTPASIST